MKTIRLLPIVIFAAAALLVFKGIGLMTNGGYVLVGTSTVQAAGKAAADHSGGGAGGGEAPAEGGDGSATLADHTMNDSAPTAEDGSPTMSLEDPAAATAGGGHGGAAAEGAPAEGSAAPGTEAAPAADAAVACPPVDAAKADGATAPASEAPAADAAPAEGHATDAAAAVPCDPAQVTAEGDAIPMIMGPDGKLIPVEGNGSSEAAVVQRLGERRTELDKREEELAMRMALVDAAEKRINEKSALLEKLQTTIDSSVDQAKSGEEAQFKSVVAMYETMKPKEAAAIFNELDLNTLLRVAVAMNPRKMAPIMAKMDPIKAKDLTTAMAIAPTEPTVAVTAEDIAALPQIVGQ